MSKQSLIVTSGAVAVGIFGSWFAINQEKHHRIQSQRHDSEQLNFESNFENEGQEENVLRQSWVHELQLPENLILKHPLDRRELILVDENNSRINKIPLKCSSTSVELNLKGIYLYDAAAITGSFYDLFQTAKMKIAANSKQIMHEIDVSNYWFPNYDFKLYLCYQLNYTNSMNILCQNVQFEQEYIEKEIAQSQHSRYKSKVSIKNWSKSFTVKKIGLPFEMGELYMKCIHYVATDTYIVFFRFGSIKRNKKSIACTNLKTFYELKQGIQKNYQFCFSDQSQLECQFSVAPSETVDLKFLI